MNVWYESVYKGFLVACAIIFILSFSFTGETQFNAMITGYSLMIISISLIIIVLLSKMHKNAGDNSALTSFLNIIMNTGPYILMLTIACIIISIQVTYKSEIITENVSTGYTSFNNIALILFIAQIYILFSAMKTTKFQTTGQLPSIVSGVVCLLDIIIALCAVILFIILKYYTTDG